MSAAEQMVERFAEIVETLLAALPAEEQEMFLRALNDDIALVKDLLR